MDVDRARAKLVMAQGARESVEARAEEWRTKAQDNLARVHKLELELARVRTEAEDTCQSEKQT